MSEDFTRQSAEALATGDRVQALVLALKALPENPTDTDLQTYPNAYAALLRATISQSVRLDLGAASYASFSPVGGRVVTTDMMPAEPSIPSQGAVLWDTSTGTRIATLVTPGELITPLNGSWLAAFSPDGRYVAVSSRATKRVSVHDTATGSELASIATLVDDPQNGDVQVGFSPDGSLFAALDAGTVLRFFEPGTWRELARFEEPDRKNGWLLAPGGAGRDFYLARPHPVQNYAFVVMELARVTPEGMSSLFWTPEADGPQGGGPFPPTIDQTGRQVIFRNGNMDLSLYEMNGTRKLFLPMATVGFSDAVVVRDGSAILVRSLQTGRDGVMEMSLFSMDGTPAPLDLEDDLPFAHSIHSPTGTLINAQPLFMPSYAGAQVPRGLALYQMVWASIPEGLKAEIRTDRVPRP